MLVGVVNTVVGTAVMFVFYNVFGLSYWVSSASNYFFGSLCSYVLNKRYTFRYRGRSISSVVMFTLNIVVCYIISYGLAKTIMMYILSGYDKAVQENASMLLGMVVFVVLNYFGQRLIVFREKDVKE